MISGAVINFARGQAAPLAVACSLLFCATTARASVTDLVITEVDAIGGKVEVTNTSTDAVSVATDLPFSHLGDVSSTIAAGTTFAPGESKVFTVTGLNAVDSDLWLYKDTNFSQSSSIISGLKWGAAPNVGQIAVAVNAGIWPATDASIAAQTSADLSLRLMAYDSHVPANWAEGEPSPLAWFGTGTAIDDPLPPIPKGDVVVDLEPVASGLASPVTVVEPDDNSGRLFICDQAGKVVIVKDGVQQAEPLIDVSNRLVSLRNYDERGLIGFTVHPNFAQNPKVYTYSSEPLSSIPASMPSTPVTGTFDHQGVIAEWTIDGTNPNQVDMSSRREILRIDEPESNHNGGTLHFGPDGYLYISLGDGGAGDDQGDGHLPNGNAQNLDNPLGKILRIQVDGGPFPNGHYGIPADNPFVNADGLDEIWAYGMRNPYSFSFDTATGDLYLGGVGQNKVEEINIVTAGANCGWRLKEGRFFFDANGDENGFVTTIPVMPLPHNLLEPIAQYDHDDGISIIGGYVYHGTAVAGLDNRYVFGDFGTSFSTPSGHLFYLNASGDINRLVLGTEDRELDLFVKGMGQDRDGEVYVCASSTLGPKGTTGVVFKIVGQASAQDWDLYK